MKATLTAFLVLAVTSVVVAGADYWNWTDQKAKFLAACSGMPGANLQKCECTEAVISRDLDLGAQELFRSSFTQFSTLNTIGADTRAAIQQASITAAGECKALGQA